MSTTFRVALDGQNYGLRFQTVGFGGIREIVESDLTVDVNARASKAANLSDLASPSAARTNLGLGSAATRDIGTASGTVAAGDDTRIVNASANAADYLETTAALSFVKPDSVRLFMVGDSFSVGVGASNAATTSYRALLTADLTWDFSGAPFYQSGSCVADRAAQVYGQTPAEGDVGVFFLGVNDQRTYTASGQRPIFEKSWRALVAWMGLLPGKDKLTARATAIGLTGSWSNTGVYGIGKNSTTNGDILNAIVNGDRVLIASIAQDGNGGTFKVEIATNGGSYVEYDTVNCFAGGNIATPNGIAYAPQLWVSPVLPKGKQDVKITVTSATGAGNIVYIDWIAGSDAAKARKGPKIYAGTIPRMTSAGYTAFGGSDANVGRFNAMLTESAGFLAALGIDVTLADTYGAIDPATDLDADGIHPNDSGHSKLYQAFKRAISILSQPSERQRALDVTSNILGGPGQDAVFGYWAGGTFVETGRLTTDGKLWLGDATGADPITGVADLLMKLSNAAFAFHNIAGDAYAVVQGGAVKVYMQAAGGSSIDARIGTQTNHAFKLLANNAVVATAATNGRFGIGEETPDYPLDVNGALGFTPGASVTPVDNGDVVFELTNNTTLTVKAKGSDGVVRSGTVTLA